MSTNSSLCIGQLPNFAGNFDDANLIILSLVIMFVVLKVQCYIRISFSVNFSSKFPWYALHFSPYFYQLEW